MINENFAKAIEHIKIENELNYIDAVLLWCKNNGAEEETAAAIIKKDPHLKLKVFHTAANLHLIKNSTGNTLSFA